MEDREKKSVKIVAIIAIICILLIVSLVIILKFTGKKGNEDKSNETDFSTGVVTEEIDQSVYNTNGIEKSDGFSSQQAVTDDWQGDGYNPENPAGVEGQNPPVYSDMSNVIGGKSETGDFQNNAFDADNNSMFGSMDDSFGNDFSENGLLSNKYSDEEIEKERLAEIENFAESERNRLNNAGNNSLDAERQKIADSERRKLEEAERKAQEERQRIADAEKKRLAAVEKAEADEAARLAAVEKSLAEEAKRQAEVERQRIAAENAKTEEARRIAAAEKAKADEAARRTANKKTEDAKKVAAAENTNSNNIKDEGSRKSTAGDEQWANEKTRLAAADRKNTRTDNLGDTYGNKALNVEDKKMFNELENLFNSYEKADSNSEKQAVLAKALPISEKVISSGKNNPKAHFFMSRDDYNNRRYNDAIDELNKSIALEDNYLYYHELGKLRYMSKDYEGAIKAFKKACQLNANFAPSRYNLGLSLVKVNKIDQGLSCYKQAVAINPNYVQAHLGMARLYKQVRYYNDAIKSYKKAIEIDPKNIPARMDLGVIYNERGDFDEAIDVYNDALQYLSEGEMQTIIKYNLSIALFHKGDYDKALAVAKESYDEKDYLKDASSKSNVVYNYGLIYETIGKTDEAIDLYKEAISIYKSHIKAKVNLSVIYMKQENPDMEEIFRLLNEAYVVAPFNYEVNNNMGNAYVLNGDYNTAIVYFETALDANPNDQVVKQNLANAYLKAEDYENAEVIYLEILKKSPKNWQANLDLAKVYIQLQDRESARKYLEYIKNNKPDFKPEEVNGLLGAL